MVELTVIAAGITVSGAVTAIVTRLAAAQASTGVHEVLSFLWGQGPRVVGVGGGGCGWCVVRATYVLLQSIKPLVHVVK